MRLGVLSIWLFLGCSSPLTEARSSFEEARYPDAVEQYARLATTVQGLSTRELFEYSLYRGLSHLALGDAASAERWLTVCKRLVDASPEHASLPEVNRLLSARRAMGHASGD
jgi:hypothetical protein